MPRGAGIEDELLRHLNETFSFYHQALEHFPSDAVSALAVAHNQLGMIRATVGDTDRAVTHYCESIRYEEKQQRLRRIPDS